MSSPFGPSPGGVRRNWLTSHQILPMSCQTRPSPTLGQFVANVGRNWSNSVQHRSTSEHVLSIPSRNWPIRSNLAQSWRHEARGRPSSTPVSAQLRPTSGDLDTGLGPMRAKRSSGIAAYAECAVAACAAYQVYGRCRAPMGRCVLLHARSGGYEGQRTSPGAPWERRTTLAGGGAPGARPAVTPRWGWLENSEAA